MPVTYDMRDLLLALRNALGDTPLPVVVKAVADGFESAGVRTAIVAIQQGNATPMVENRIGQQDVAGAALSSLGQKLGAWLTMQAKPKARGPKPKR